MMSSASPHQRMIIGTLAAGAVLLAALWLLALSPKRAESAEVKTNVAAQEQRLTAAQGPARELPDAHASSTTACSPSSSASTRRFPARGAIPELLRQLQKRATGRDTELRLAALKPASSRERLAAA